MKLVLRFGLAAAAIVMALPGIARPQDHEKCYKIKDPAKIAGMADLTTPQFGLEPGCKLGPAKFFCAPAFKTVISVTSNKLPIAPLPLYAPPAPTDRICYKVKCPVPPPPFPPDQNVTDQFGNRTLMKFKASYVCTPAVKGPGYCGNAVIDPGEDCDGLALGACTVGCRANCTCQCETACCYQENAAAPPDTECIQYSGNPLQVANFLANCTNAPGLAGPGSLPLGATINSAVPGPCVAGPLFGQVCLPPPPAGANLHMIPQDSTCP